MGAIKTMLFTQKTKLLTVAPNLDKKNFTIIEAFIETRVTKN